MMKGLPIIEISSQIGLLEGVVIKIPGAMYQA